MSRNSEPTEPGLPLAPRLVLRLLELVVVEEDREALLGDLLEEYDALARESSPTRARRWLWEQAIGSIAPMVWRRLVKAMSGALFGKPALRLQAVTEGANMFERSMLDGSRGRLPGRKWWLVPAAVAIHFTVFIGISVARMWDLDELGEPMIEAAYIPVMLPKPPPPPPGPKGNNGPRHPQAPGKAHTVRTETPRQPVAIPIAIPEVTISETAMPDVPMELEFEAASSDQAGVPDGQPDGVPWGIDNGQGSGQPVPVAGNVVPPVVTHRVEPRYTELARRAGIQGVILIEATIDRQGNVVGARILRGLGGGLNEESIRKVEQWKFKPATLNGRPIAVYFNVTITFIFNRG